MGGRGSGRRYPQLDEQLGPVVRSWHPVRVIGAEQRGGPEDAPATCPKCHMGWPMWRRGYWYSECFCGYRYVRTIGEAYARARPRERAPEC